jgi:hypothetical protein
VGESEHEKALYHFVFLLAKKKNPARESGIFLLLTKLATTLCRLALLCLLYGLLCGLSLFCHGGGELKVTADMSTRPRARNNSHAQTFLYIIIARNILFVYEKNVTCG